MQTPDKLTRPFIFKLLVLFALLLSGAMLKVPKTDKSSGSNTSRKISDADAMPEDNQTSAQITFGLLN
ncbi:hypothetical protein FVR03_08380 [Pontibacter qinzhouensis]|uniref:Uncharacterized protein n=1 Tax=Pontibacter qinzhouensis TaxID=2603253 RepID=A0A5C8KBG9_9BACT|nr:hypothetical protein [Pontibacter qinzhouensis]TXK48037.1 hypothetical protein FVR03_08380 [Pontibacter qinzhouensis]